MVTGVIPLSSTVELSRAGRVVAREPVGSSGAFHFAPPPGTYRLDVATVPRCAGTVRVRSGKPASVSVICDTWNGFRSIVAQTLDAPGAERSAAALVASFVSDPANEGSTRVEVAETTLGDYDRATTPDGGQEGVSPYHPGTPVWVLCASGGAYATFTGRNSYANKCEVGLVRQGTVIEHQEFDGRWPGWFGHLPHVRSAT